MYKQSEVCKIGVNQRKNTGPCFSIKLQVLLLFSRKKKKKQQQQHKVILGRFSGPLLDYSKNLIKAVLGLVIQKLINTNQSR